MKKLYNSRLFWMIVSLAASLTIWMYVTSAQNDVVRTTFKGVKVEFVGEEVLRSTKNLVITDLDNASVNVVLSGPRRAIMSLDAEDLSACVDVSKLSRSAFTSQQYYISYPEGVDTSKITVSGKVPDTVSFMVSPLNTKTVQVRGSFDGSLAPGCTAEAPVFEPSTITVSGPDSYLKNVSYAWVTFSMDNVSSTYSTEVPFVLMDENGDECSTAGLTCSEDTVTATLPLLLVKDIPISVDLIEGSGATKANTKIKIEPESITLAGDSALLEGMNKIVVGTIDLTEFSSTFSETYPITIDNELRNLTGATEAKVDIEIVGLETKKFIVRNISCMGVTEGYAADIITESIEVTVRGTAEQLAELKGDNIRAVADLTDFKESVGNYSPAVKIMVDGFTDVGAVGGPYTVSVEIRKAVP